MGSEQQADFGVPMTMEFNTAQLFCLNHFQLQSTLAGVSRVFYHDVAHDLDRSVSSA